jgi:hypothetical protein
MKTSWKTNRQVLTKAIKELSEIELIFLRERILNACDEVLNNEAKIRESMQNGFVHPDLYIKSMNSIKNKVNFD